MNQKRSSKRCSRRKRKRSRKRSKRQTKKVKVDAKKLSTLSSKVAHLNQQLYYNNLVLSDLFNKLYTTTK